MVQWSNADVITEWARTQIGPEWARTQNGPMLKFDLDSPKIPKIWGQKVASLRFGESIIMKSLIKIPKFKKLLNVEIRFNLD